MSRADLKMKSRKMDLEEDFYAFDFDNEEDAEEEMQGYRSQGELEVALRQKEEEVILAAQLGNALLQENRQLKEEADKLHEHYTVKLEVRARSDSRCCSAEKKVARCLLSWCSSFPCLEVGLKLVMRKAIELGITALKF